MKHARLEIHYPKEKIERFVKTSQKSELAKTMEKRFEETSTYKIEYRKTWPLKEFKFKLKE